MLDFLGMTINEHTVCARHLGFVRSMSTDVTSEATASPKDEWEEQKQKRRRKRIGQLMTGDEHPLPQGFPGPRCDGEGDV